MDLVDKYLGEADKLAGWIAIYGGKKLEIKKSEADGIYGAKQLAIKKLKVPKSKVGLMAIEPAYESTNIDEIHGRGMAGRITVAMKDRKKAENILKKKGIRHSYKNGAIIVGDDDFDDAEEALARAGIF